MAFPGDAPPLPPFEARLGDRSLFPDLEARVYANHAAISPPSRASLYGLEQGARIMARHGVAGFGPMSAQRGRLKTTLASLIGARPDEIALVLNTSAGIAAIAQCMPWKPRDRVIVFTGEFPANVTPWQRAAATFDLETVFLPIADLARPDGPDYSALDAALAAGARLVCISAVQFQSGLRAPLAEISTRAHGVGAEVCVDGIQAVGCCPLDVGRTGIDYLVCGGHKWLMGPEGAGFAWARAECAAALVPRLAGWLSHEEPVDFLFAPGKLRYDKPVRRTLDFLEGGAPNLLGYAALEGAVQCLAQIGVEAIFEHVQTWLDRLEPALVKRGFVSNRMPDRARRSGILTVVPPAPLTAVQLSEGLGARGIACTTPEGLLRFAPHWPNALDEVPIVIAALDDVLADV